MAITLRLAVPKDVGTLGRMGAQLAGQHHGFDAERFMLPEDIEAGYRWWLGKELKQKEAVVVVAERDGEVVGYAYGRVEERDWNALRDTCGVLHDLWVDASARGSGTGARLAEEVVQRLKALGVPRVVLMAAAKNEVAQRLFARLGWRATMVELTRET
ncbi:GNAT family N-acetyltransferase [Stigmatella aurantiaca]|uniref:Acetyltransferase, GNAT family n=1 Tax=Stigmatella aurantiaca (strain DW4/3-1) TaxID=378806 RepID=Q08SC9_STIAD|nr:GNAT family N-acetyltransferase [Stigmatella aurantiaca]ADO70709.1 Acetyltransferase, GNAT family [Stigmatella aurantiaca DW4/3-1]EAU63391.1 transcriptional Regulator, MarR family, putative [Stigmatella aurantiaca DW4/3-1]